MVFPLNLLVLSQFLSCQPHHHPPNTLSQSLSPSLFSPQPPSIFIITVRLLSLPFFPYPSHSFTTTILSLIQLHISLPFPYESFTFLHLSLHLAYIFSLSLTHFISLVSSLFSSFFSHHHRLLFLPVFLYLHQSEWRLLHSFFTLNPLSH